MANLSTDVLKMALVGYEQASEKIDAVIADIQAQLGRRGPGRPKAILGDGAGQTARKRVLSAAARRRIGLAQRKRWAAQRRAKSEAQRPKRKLSAAGRAAIIAATKKRWAAFHKRRGLKKTAG